MLFIWLVGCQQAPPVPAILSAPGEDATAIISEALRQATGQEVVLDEKVFVTESYLYLTPRERRSVAQTRRLGRAVVSPLRFDLALRGRHCVLIDARNDKVHVLDGLQCNPLVN